MSQLAHRLEAYPDFRSMKRLGVFLLPLDGMLVHRRSVPSNLLGFPQQFVGIHLYSWVEKGTVRVKCLPQEHNAMSPARSQTWTARCRDERTNHEATAPPTQSPIMKSLLIPNPHNDKLKFFNEVQCMNICLLMNSKTMKLVSAKCVGKKVCQDARAAVKL